MGVGGLGSCSLSVRLLDGGLGSCSLSVMLLDGVLGVWVPVR